MFASGSSHASSYSNNSWICVSQRKIKKEKQPTKSALLDDVHYKTTCTGIWWCLLWKKKKKMKWKICTANKWNTHWSHGVDCFVLLLWVTSVLRHTSLNTEDRLLTAASGLVIEGLAVEILAPVCMSERPWAWPWTPVVQAAATQWCSNVKVLGRARHRAVTPAVERQLGFLLGTFHTNFSTKLHQAIWFIFGGFGLGLIWL